MAIIVSIYWLQFKAHVEENLFTSIEALSIFEKSIFSWQTLNDRLQG